MKIADWGLWAVLETAKYMILTYGILGFEPRKGKQKYLVFLYPTAGVLIVHLEQYTLLYKTLWGMVLLVVYFEGRGLKKLESFVVEFMMISAMELWGRSAFVLIFGMEMVEHSSILGWMVEIFSIVVWILIVIVLKNRRKKIRKVFEELPFSYFCLAFCTFAGIVIAITLAWGIMHESYRDVVKQWFFVGLVLVMFLVVIIMLVFIYFWQKKNEFQEIAVLTKRCYDYQKNYYEGIIRKDEELRGFRHDIRKHMSAISVLCEKGETKKIQEYIQELYGSLEDLTVCRTGNAIADYFISQTVEELRADGVLDYTVAGRFPAKLRLSESDICILLGNAMDNAREALLKCREGRRLEIDIKSYQDRLFLTIANTTVAEELRMVTSKRDKGQHGYGIKNMERVTEKYGGNLRYDIEGDRFVLRMEI